jgi:hypothetical protein
VQHHSFLNSTMDWGEWSTTCPGCSSPEELNFSSMQLHRSMGGHQRFLQLLEKKKKLQFLLYGRSIGSWICLTHKMYTCHTVQNMYSASMAVSDSQSIFHFNLRCLSYSTLFRFLSRMRCTSMGVWCSMIY